MRQPKKKTKKEISLQDLLKAEVDPTIQAKMRQKETAAPVLTGEDMMAVRLFARMTLPVARQRNKDMTVDLLTDRLAAVLKSIRNPLRKIMLRQMKAYVNDKSV